MKRPPTASTPDAPPGLAGDGLPLQARNARDAESGLETIDAARRIFVEGGDLSTFWADSPGFTIVDTFLDDGSRFLATWSAWCNDPRARERLHYVVFDPNETTRETLIARWRSFLRARSDAESVDASHAQLTPEAARSITGSEHASCHIQHLRQLIDIWPCVVVEGIRTLELDGGRIVLTLAIGNVTALARNMRLRGDAFFLRAAEYGELLAGKQKGEDSNSDFSQICKALARMAAVGAPIVAPCRPGQGYPRSHAIARGTDAKSESELESALGQNTMTASMTAAGFEVSVKRVACASEKPADSADSAEQATASAREILLGHFAPRWRVRRHPPPAAPEKMATAAAAEARETGKTALVIGAGLAGCHVVERLTAKGWKVRLIDSADRPANGASGNPAGVFHPMITADEGLAARLSRSGFLHALSRWQALERAGHTIRWSRTGLLQLGPSRQDDRDDDRANGQMTTGVAVSAAQQDARGNPAQNVSYTAQPPGLPKSIVEEVDAQTANGLIGISDAAYPSASWLFKQGGWIDPISLCHALLAASQEKLTCHFGRLVDRLEHRDQMWRALDQNGAEIGAAHIVVIANAYDAQRLARLRHVNMDNIRGQLTFLPAGVVPGLARPVIGNGYLTPSPDGAITGASYGVGDTRREIDPKDHADNLDRLAYLLGRDLATDATICAVPPLPGTVDAKANVGIATSKANAGNSSPFGLDVNALRGRVAFRCTSRDRLPMIGMLGDEQRTAQRAGGLTGAHALDLPRRDGLYAAFGYGSRGLIWSALAAELLLSQIEHTPPPIETDLVDAIDPARFLLRDVRRGKVR